MARIVLPKPVEVVVTSFGGVGTTFLLEHLAKFRVTNHPYDADGLKHLPVPPISRHENVRFLYVFGDPVSATISLFRRGFQRPQSKKLLRYRISPSPVTAGATLDEYARAGIDRFRFRFHFYNWYGGYLVHPTLFVRYETIFNNLSAIVEFLDLPQEFIDSFPKRRVRTSEGIDIRPETMATLELMYGGFAKELGNLPDTVVRIPDSRRSTWQIYTSSPYPLAVLNQAFDLRLQLRDRAPRVYRLLSRAKGRLFLHG